MRTDPRSSAFYILTVCIVLLFLPIDSLAQEFERPRIKVEIVADNLTVPWSIDFAPDGRIFFTERRRDVRIIEDGVLLARPAISFNISDTEGGLLGLALDPNFEHNHYVYLYYTYKDSAGTYNRVARYTESNNVLLEEEILIDQIPGSKWHNGGRIKFGPDGMLYVTTGDATNSSSAQDPNSLAGKILRINPDGSIPKDNPFGNSPVFSLGHRNPQGISWHPDSNIMVATEHGPSGEKGFGHDEINIIRAGRNYGWPWVVGAQTSENTEAPLLDTGEDTWAPSGATFYSSEQVPEWTNKFFVATLRGSHLRVLDLDLENKKVISSEALFEGVFGRLRDVAVDPQGFLYILTSNTDGRGFPQPNDDKILRVFSWVEEILPPLSQLKNGIDPTNVKCKEGLELIFKKTNLKPACVKPTSVHRLTEIGWAFPDPKELYDK